MADTVLELDRLIIDTVGSLVIVTDDQGRIIRFNPAAARILEYQPEEVLGKRICDLFPLPEERDGCRDRFRQLMSGAPIEIQVVWLSKSGKRKHLSFICHGARGPGGRIEYTVGTGIDITDRVLSEETLKENEHRFRTTFEGASIGIALVDEFGSYRDVNPAFCRMIGYEKRELLDTNLASLTHPDDRGENLKLLHELAIGDREGYVFEKRYITKSGEWIWVKVSASLANVGRGQPVTIIGLFENISDRIKAERTLENEYQEIERQVRQRTAELAESEQEARALSDSNLLLAREVEHRVRNNLAGLLALITAMRSGATDVKTFANAIESRIAAMAQVHQRLAGGKWSTLALSDLIHGAIDTMRHLCPYPALTEVTGPQVIVSERQVLPLTMVLVEWFMNSCKYGPHSVPDGRVRISWTANHQAQGTAVRLQWTERNGPRIVHPIKPSLGTDLVQGFVRRELGGTCELRYPPEGVDHEVEFFVSGECPASTVAR